MRINYILQHNCTPTLSDIDSGCRKFYEQFKILPDTIKMSYSDLSAFMVSNGYSIDRTKILEMGKDYGLFHAIPGGIVQLSLLEAEDEFTVNAVGVTSSFIVVENNKINNAFEGIVLGRDV